MIGHVTSSVLCKDSTYRPRDIVGQRRSFIHFTLAAFMARYYGWFQFNPQVGHIKCTERVFEPLLATYVPISIGEKSTGFICFTFRNFDDQVFIIGGLNLIPNKCIERVLGLLPIAITRIFPHWPMGFTL